MEICCSSLVVVIIIIIIVWKIEPSIRQRKISHQPSISKHKLVKRNSRNMTGQLKSFTSGYARVFYQKVKTNVSRKHTLMKSSVLFMVISPAFPSSLQASSLVFGYRARQYRKLRVTGEKNGAGKFCRLDLLLGFAGWLTRLQRVRVTFERDTPNGDTLLTGFLPSFMIIKNPERNN